MHAIRRLLTLTACLAPLALGVAAAEAQRAPTLSQAVISSAELNAQQQADVNEFVDYYCERLCNEDAGTIVEARTNLVRHFLTGSPSGTFRHHFSRRAVPQLKTTIEDCERPLGVVNALIALPFIGSDDAMEALLAHVDSSQEDRSYVRIRAAMGTEVMLDRGGLTEARIAGYLRELGTAAEHETHPWALRHMLRALRVVAIEQRPAQDSLTDAVERVVTNVENESGDDLAADVMTYRHAIGHTREVWLDPQLSSTDRPDLKAKMIPLLERFRDHAQAEVANGKADIYQAALDDTLTLLRFMNG